MTEAADAAAHLLLSDGSVPLGFVRDRSSVFLVARSRSALWPAEILRAGRARIRLPDSELEGPVELVARREERARVLDAFRAKYGEERFRRWYDAPARILEVRTDGSAPAPGDRAGPYYDWLASEFDNVATEYDRHITGNTINRLLRDRSLRHLRATLDGHRSILEIGCGTGVETLPLLRDGHEILAVDISEEMLRVVRDKARREGVGERLRTIRMPARDLPGIVPQLGAGAFDGAFSTYGAFNCEPDLRPIPPTLHELLRDGAPLVTGIYNRWCLWEALGYSLVGRYARAIGRTRRPVRVGSSRFCVDVYAHSPGEIRRLFAPLFSFEEIEGVPVLLPPSDLAEYADRFDRHFATLARWDLRFGRRFPFSHLGDHFLMTFRRAGT